jgi:hypothetical protein
VDDVLHEHALERLHTIAPNIDNKYCHFDFVTTADASCILGALTPRNGLEWLKSNQKPINY